MLSILLASSFALDLFGQTSTQPESQEAKLPSLVIYVSDHCPYGEKAEKEIIPSLVEAGWRLNRDYTVIYSTEKDCPTFEYQGQRFCEEGWTDLSTFNRGLKKQMGLEVTVPTYQEPVRVYQEPVRVYQEPVRASNTVHSHRCRNCGNTWTHGNENVGNHSAHLCPVCSTLTWGNRSEGYSQTAYEQPVFRAYCPTGNCP